MNIETARLQMIEQQVRACEVSNPEVLRVLGSVPREKFVPAAFRTLAFADTEIPLGHGQRMMTPRLEGLILQALDVGPADRVLDIGTGSGYLAACLAMLGGEVTSLEIHADLAGSARRALQAAGEYRVEVLERDVFDWQPVGRYGRIVVGGSLPLYDARFENWLEPGGRMFVVAGAPPVMEARLVSADSGATTQRYLFDTDLPALANAPHPARFRL